MFADDTLSCFPIQVEKELAELTSKWECFKNKWIQVLAQQRHESGKRRALLKCLRREINYFMSITKLLGYADAESLLHLPSLLSSFTTQLQHTVHSAFKERLIVGPCEVSQVKFFPFCQGMENTLKSDWLSFILSLLCAYP